MSKCRRWLKYSVHIYVLLNVEYNVVKESNHNPNLSLDDKKKLVANFIKESRTSSNRSNHLVWKESGISKTLLSNIENGKGVNFTTILKICEYYNIEITFTKTENHSEKKLTV